MTVEAQALVVSIIALAVAVLGTFGSIYFAYRSDKSKVLFDVFTEFRCEKYTTVRKLISETVVTGSEMKFEPFKEYSYFLNHIGMLLDKNYINVDEIYQMAGDSIVDSWRILGPYILHVRSESNQRKYFQFHFQYLAAQILAHRGKGSEIIGQLIIESSEKIRIYTTL